MNRSAVASSNVSSIGYDTATQTLEVEFLNGRVYQYYGVPDHMHDADHADIIQGQVPKLLHKGQLSIFSGGMTSKGARELRRLVESGFLRMEGKGRGAHYFPRPALGVTRKRAK